MTTEENKAIYGRFIEEVFRRGNLAAVDQYLAPGLVDHSGFNPTGDLVGVKQGFAMMREGFPDAEAVIEDLIAEGDKVVSRYVFRGTHNGPFMGIPATGKQVEMGGIEVVRFFEGRMVEHWEQFDALGLMQQLGAVPTPEQGQP